MSTFVRNVGLKRRKVVSSKGLQKSPEIKQCNFILSNGSYTALSVVPYTLDTTHYLYRPYHAIAMAKPNLGTEAFNRIGNKINIKWIRLKGYITIFDRLITTCRLKFFLIRSYSRTLTDTDIANMYNDWQPINYAEPNVWTILTNCRHNYFKATLNPNAVGRDKGVVINKICEIKLNPSAHNMSVTNVLATTLTTTTSNQVQTTTVPANYYTKEYDYEAVDNIPFDVRISVQETIDCAKDYYYLYVMQDYPYCTDNTVKTTTYYPYPKAITGYEANFFARYYYTDA